MGATTANPSLGPQNLTLRHCKYVADLLDPQAELTK